MEKECCNCKFIWDTKLAEEKCFKCNYKNDKWESKEESVGNQE